jgi:hypothetical protein
MITPTPRRKVRGASLDAKRRLAKVYSESEKWKDIPGYEGKYQASNIGRLKNILKGNIVSGGINKANGYRYAYLMGLDGSKRNHRVHRLIAMSHLANPKSLPYVNHKDGNKVNNNIDNLEWCTAEENCQHALENGLVPSGEKHHYAKLTSEEVEAIRRIGDILPSRRVAKMFGISKTNVLDILNGNIWAYAQ